MKKLLIISALLLISFSSYSQKIERSIIDDFTGNKLINTSWERIYVGGATGKNQKGYDFLYSMEIFIWA